MTEAEWLACTDPQKMLLLLEDIGSNRKLRLFACACCRSMWHLLTEQACREAVEVAERYADKQASRKDLDPAADAAREACWRVGSDGPARYAAGSAYYAAASRPRGWPRHLNAHNAWVVLPRSRNATGSSLIRCIFGNPFQPVALAPTWLTSSVTLLAHVAYNERILPSGHLDSVQLAILSDALEEAGCTDRAVLDHLRSPGPHVRGCWVVDLILGKE